MYLKSLELQGFKSFPDKIKLEFNKGLTAVIGPNGSGKSNIGDAVRWVLGEQSSKTLRGSKMEDVIFSGTQFRKSVGFAQVTLNIDNLQGVLQIPAEEVSVTRKLYRSGESEYLLNGSPVRLKDVYELFMDTGLGRDGYSIIGQGRIADIVSSKSSERREIFEEAAGISKFRYRKAEAERRLSAAQENILRLKDILGELESRVEPLRVQSEKAAQFIELSEKKKALEVSVWIKKLEELKTSLTELDEKFLISNAEYENAETDTQRIDEGIQAAYKAMQECNIRVESLQAQILETERSKGQIGSDVAVYENDIRHSLEAIDGIVKQQENARLSEEETAVKIIERTARAQNMGKDLETAAEILVKTRLELEQLMSETGDFDRDYENSGNVLNQLYMRQSEYNFSIRSAQDSLNEIDEQLQLGINHERELSDAADEMNKELVELVSGLQKIEEKLAEQSNKLSGYSRLYEAKLQKLEVAKKSYEQSAYKLKEKQQKVQLLSDLENSMEGFAHSVKEIIKAQKTSRISGIKGSVAQLIQVDSRYSLAVETALGAALQNVVVENEETAKRCIRLLKEQNAGRATFLPITSIRGNSLAERGLEEQDGFVALAENLVTCDTQFSGIIKSLLGRIAIAEDIDCATIMAKKFGYKFKIVTLDGQVINAGGSFTGGSVSRSTGVLTRKNEISALHEEIQKLSAEFDVYKANILKMQSETDKLKFDIEGEKETGALINEDKIRFQSEQRRIELMLDQMRSQLETTVSQILKLKERHREQTEKLNSSTESLEVCGKEIEQKEQQMAQTQDKKDSLHQKREELSAEISAMKIRQMELSKDKEATWILSIKKRLFQRDNPSLISRQKM